MIFEEKIPQRLIKTVFIVGLFFIILCGRDYCKQYTKLLEGVNEDIIARLVTDVIFVAGGVIWILSMFKRRV